MTVGELLLLTGFIPSYRESLDKMTLSNEMILRFMDKCGLLGSPMSEKDKMTGLDKRHLEKTYDVTVIN